ncbi:NADPH-dependent 2,4-dienoyl-CoA reductase/sulfur reductase-like enzyme [Crossiella equi]|uniref:NADPH-dependent 2,4-dienoyl-CoA reductase/sulfur reductase-like enzyme n=1 Tax=Crossiella equi TaxID=130796 RepID=A0ABS5AP37_9PSEU|nr:FAD-dependent oxidoreductase [Crossiella equi]MBP2477460.1 NADPH-dependent 2,4-dienoyl-CoA reductase/sulfur reductase-like enzyme [Crossiella equi]
MGLTERIVVVGAGPAGLNAAERLRELGFGGEVVVVGEEVRPPYHRPGLVQQLITGHAGPEELALPGAPALDAIWRLGSRAAALDTDRRLLLLPHGEEMRYDGLVLATGSQARHLPGAPRHDHRVTVLRTMADAVALQGNLLHGRGPVVIVGGGFLGCELAASLRAADIPVVLVDRGATLLGDVLGDRFGEAVTTLHREAGVQLALGATVWRFAPYQGGVAVRLTDGQIFGARCVVLTVGAVPASFWLRGSGLVLEDGVLCDATCHALGAQDVVVAGDLARWPNLRFDEVPRRVEHWITAVEMGRAAAESLLAGTAARPFTPLPHFWSAQHGVRIQAAGAPALAGDTIALAGSRSLGHQVRGYVRNGWLVGVAAWDSPRGMRQWTAELDRQSAIGPRPSPGETAAPQGMPRARRRRAARPGTE